MKSLVATITLIVLVLTGILIYKKSLAPVEPQEVEEVLVDLMTTTTNEVATTTTATSTDEEN
jgi:hypothetical protein